MDILQGVTFGPDRFELAGFTFLLQHQRPENTSPDGFVVYKQPRQLSQYQALFAQTGFAPRTMLELGIWDGGSAAFWTEALGLEAYVAIDLQERGDSEYFRSWLARRGHGRVRTHWGVDQTDAAALAAILEPDLREIDIVIDDASHMPGPTIRSFEILFPRVRPGGWYVIEDWAWALQPEFQSKSHPWSVLPALHPVIHRLIELQGSKPDMIEAIHVLPEAVVVVRGTAVPEDLDVKTEIARRGRPVGRIVAKRARRTAGAVRRGIRARRTPPS